MAGFDFNAGRSNNMVAAEERGMVTIGRWAKRHRVSAAAAVVIMRPSEAHHTGTGFRGRSRLTPVIAASAEPTEAQLAAMRSYDPAQVERDRRAVEAAKPLVVNEYGNVDVRGGCENGVMVAELPAPRAALRAAGVVFGEAMTGFSKSRGRYVPDLDGWVLELAWAEKLAAAPPYVAPPPPKQPAPTDAVKSEPAPERAARPLTDDELVALDGSDLSALAPMKRRERKAFLFAAKLPNRAEALDFIAERCEAVLA